MFTLPNLSPSQWAVIAGLLAVFVGLTLLAIWDAFRREFKTSGEKMAWIQLCVLVPFLGGVAYLLLGKKRGRKTQ